MIRGKNLFKSENGRNKIPTVFFSWEKPGQNNSSFSLGEFLFSLCRRSWIHICEMNVCVCAVRAGVKTPNTLHMSAAPSPGTQIFSSFAKQGEWIGKKKNFFSCACESHSEIVVRFFFQHWYYTYSRYFPAISSKDFLLLRFFLLNWWFRFDSILGEGKISLRCDEARFKARSRFR